MSPPKARGWACHRLRRLTGLDRHVLFTSGASGNRRCVPAAARAGALSVEARVMARHAGVRHGSGAGRTRYGRCKDGPVNPPRSQIPSPSAQIEFRALGHAVPLGCYERDGYDAAGLLESHDVELLVRVRKPDGAFDATMLLVADWPENTEVLTGIESPTDALSAPLFSAT